MLSDKERHEIQAEADEYPERRGACVKALQVVQREHGWVSDEHLREVAQILGMTPDELDGVATFYSLIYREPVGHHVILICDSVTCWIMGYDALLEGLKSRLGIDLGGTTNDHRFTLLPVACLGACDHAPAMMIDETLYTDVRVEQLDEILAQYE
jgi:NADH-quinone oxidoreductase subunit E